MLDWLVAILSSPLFQVIRINNSSLFQAECKIIELSSVSARLKYYEYENDVMQEKDPKNSKQNSGNLFKIYNSHNGNIASRVFDIK